MHSKKDNDNYYKMLKMKDELTLVVNKFNTMTMYSFWICEFFIMLVRVGFPKF